MLLQTLVLFVAPVAMAATPRARSGLPKSFAQSKLLNTLVTCELGYVACENGCMPPDGVCCNDNTDEYCLDGYYCVPDACCPDGETCSGSSGGDAECGILEIECGDLCMPYDGTCCSDGLHYCPDFGTCTDDGYCCDLGDDCSGSSFTDFTDFTDFTTSTTSTDDDSTSTTSRTTTRTTTTTIDQESTSTTRSHTTTPTSSTTTQVSSTEAPVTSAPAATVTTTVSEQAGRVFTADSRVAAGIAVVAALLV
ncbi:hypothetical protein F4820DRAFT_442565 [Hypoxylon rubiginosum]|uniref:Uncharacterized protein n=1 Tax=Hypoxylon rubiginosum TaxID=110542 RepID=A0ACB9ZKB2_9PEZI|nr:hypothetical protein F4820DRAFT_442565 [Hypoxylon rubiginosum]